MFSIPVQFSEQSQSNIMYAGMGWEEETQDLVWGCLSFFSKEKELYLSCIQQTLFLTRTMPEDGIAVDWSPISIATSH